MILSSTILYASDSGTHYIFLIHGIGGNKRHFGNMGAALQSALKTKSNQNIVIESFEYDTNNDEKTIYDFAQDFNIYISNLLVNKDKHKYRLQQKDKVSLIMHSQGGLIGGIWLIKSLNSGNNSIIIDHLNSFITLSTPFWGTKSAIFANILIKAGIKKIKFPFGKRQLQDMSFGSDTIYRFRTALIDYANNSNHIRNKKRVRTLNIAAITEQFNFLRIFSSGTNKYEDDTAVLLPSAHLNFLYNQSILKRYKNKHKTSAKQMKELSLAPFFLVNAIHLTVPILMSPLPGVAQIPEKCIDNINCDHPSFKYIWKHLLREDLTQINTEVVKELSSFLIDLNIRLPKKDKDFAAKNIDIKFYPINKKFKSLKDCGIQLNDKFELYSKGYTQSKKNPNYHRFYITGNIANKPYPEKTILMKVKAKGFKERQIELKIRPTFSTFIDINLISDRQK